MVNSWSGPSIRRSNMDVSGLYGDVCRFYVCVKFYTLITANVDHAIECTYILKTKYVDSTVSATSILSDYIK